MSRNDTDPKPLGSGNTDPGLGPTSPGPAQPATTADVFLEGLGQGAPGSDRSSESAATSGRRGRPDSDGKLAASYHASPRPAPARHKTPEPPPAAVVVEGGEAGALDEPPEAPKGAKVAPPPAALTEDVSAAPGPAAAPAPKPRVETTVPGAPRAPRREHLLAFAATALIVGIAGVAVALYRTTFSPAPAPAPAEPPMQTLPPRVEIPDPPPPESLELDSLSAQSTATATAAPQPGPRPKSPAKGDGKGGPPPPDDFQDLKQTIER
jgi:hypothetical protein